MRNLPCFSAKIKILGPKSGNFSPFLPIFYEKARYFCKKSWRVLIKRLGIFTQRYRLTMPKFTLHFFDTLLKNSTDKISLTKRLYI